MGSHEQGGSGDAQVFAACAKHSCGNIGLTDTGGIAG